MTTKNNMTKNTYEFKNAEYPIQANTMLTDIKPYFDKFINENKINFDQYISVICQIREVGNIYYTIGERFSIDLKNSKDITDYLDYIQNKWSILDNNQYNPSSALSVIFNFTKTNHNEYLLISNKFRIIQNQSKVDVNFKDESKFDLPLNTYYNSWGKTSEMLSDGILRVKDLFIDLKSNLNRYIEVTTLSKFNSLINLISSESNIKIITFLDKIISNNQFLRELGNKTYYFKDNKLYFIYDKLVSNQFISKVKQSKGMKFNIMTLDVETYVDENNNMNIYCISMYDGVNAKSFYLTNYTDVHSLINDVLKTIFSKKYSGKSIYIHNSSNFDMIFLYSYIINYSETLVKPILKDGKFIVLEIEFGNITKYKVYFKDSFLLLSSSLDKLSKTFNVNYTKDIFPHKFVNKDNLNYIGEVPTIDFFYGLSTTDYNEYKSRFNNNWNLQSEAIKYCELDCKALFEVISNFAFKINTKFNVDVSSTPTLPSLAMKTYRTSFIPDGIKISKVGGKMFDNVHKAFYGGHVDMYIPTNPVGTQVFSYDVNSLYPHSMYTFAMPVGTPIYFAGDIFKVNPNAFGIFEVEVETPSDLKYPVLQTKLQTDSGERTIAPLGTWTGWYFSGDIVHAKKLGYKFKVLSGYLFEKEYIFKDFVEFLYKIKDNSIKGSPMYIIAKLLLNALYGKLGIDPNFDYHIIIDSNKSQEYNHKYVVTNVIDLGNNKELITYYNKNSNKDSNKPSADITSVSIALTVTAYSRMHMTDLKKVATDLGLTIYYMDTDSIAVSGELDPLFIGRELGKLKLEHIFNEVIYLAPKVYGGKSDSYEYTKVKGLKNKISFEDLKPLLTKDNSLTLNQEKWYKDIGKGHIAVKNELYTLMITENKRELIFNEEGIFIDTKPYVLTNGNLVSK